MKEIALVSNRTVIQKLIRSFSHIEFEHVPRADKHADLLATLVSKIDIPNKATDVRSLRRL